MKNIHIWPPAEKHLKNRMLAHFVKICQKDAKLAPRQRNQKKMDFFADVCKFKQKNRIWLSKTDF